MLSILLQVIGDSMSHSSSAVAHSTDQSVHVMSSVNERQRNPEIFSNSDNKVYVDNFDIAGRSPPFHEASQNEAPVLRHCFCVVLPPIYLTRRSYSFQYGKCSSECFLEVFSKLKFRTKMRSRFYEKSYLRRTLECIRPNLHGGCMAFVDHYTSPFCRSQLGSTVL